MIVITIHEGIDGGLFTPQALGYWPGAFSAQVVFTRVMLSARGGELSQGTRSRGGELSQGAESMVGPRIYFALSPRHL